MKPAKTDLAAPRRERRGLLVTVLVTLVLVLAAASLAALRLRQSDKPVARPAPDPPVVNLRAWIDGKPVRPGGTTSMLKGRKYVITVQLSSARDVKVSEFHLLLNGPRSGVIGDKPSGNFVLLAYQPRPDNPYRTSATWTATSIGGSNNVILAVLYSVANNETSASVGPSLQAIAVG